MIAKRKVTAPPVPIGTANPGCASCCARGGGSLRPTCTVIRLHKGVSHNPEFRPASADSKVRLRIYQFSEKITSIVVSTLTGSPFSSVC